MKVVHTKSIPNVDDARLIDSLEQLHATCHTVAGLRLHEESRRRLIDLGRKGLKVRDELIRRDAALPDELQQCRWCGARP